MKYDFYSECIALSENSISFRVEIYQDGRRMGDVNVLMNKIFNYSLSFLMQYEWNEELQQQVIEHCKARAECTFEIEKSL